MATRFEIVINDEPDQTSDVLADKVKSVNWTTRQSVKIGTAASLVEMETLSKRKTLL
nr:hypothetical protein [Nitrosomonas nitrosa]